MAYVSHQLGKLRPETTRSVEIRLPAFENLILRYFSNCKALEAMQNILKLVFHNATESSCPVPVQCFLLGKFVGIQVVTCITLWSHVMPLNKGQAEYSGSCTKLDWQKRISQGWMLFQKQTFHKSKRQWCPEASINSINICRNTLLGHRFTVFASVWISCQCEQWALIHLATFVVEPSASL